MFMEFNLASVFVKGGKISRKAAKPQRKDNLSGRRYESIQFHNFGGT